ncbi:MAG: 3-keto-5-aminohexanoate cleavage protein [Gaiellales bacterium]
MPSLEVALNGARSLTEHPGIPRSPEQLADEARSSVDAGAHVVHIHAFDENGRESLAPVPCSAAIRAVRAACPGVPISLTTSAVIESDPKRRFELIAAWTELPELVTANQGEPGILELCRHLSDRGVGIEAGLLGLADAQAFVRAGITDLFVRVLVEPLNADPSDAVAHATAIEEALDRAEISLEQIHHGDGPASWAVSARALARGHGMRTGLEDTTVLPDGARAPNNAALVRAAAAMIASIQ